MKTLTSNMCNINYTKRWNSSTKKCTKPNEQVPGKPVG